MFNLDFSQKGLTQVLVNFPASSFRYIPRLPPPPPGARRTTTKLSALSSTRSGGVDGFSFPLSTADEIECLEAAVRQSRRIWEQYVSKCGVLVLRFWLEDVICVGNTLALVNEVLD